MGNAQFLRSRANLPRDVEEATLQDISDAAARLDDVLKDLTTLARPELGQLLSIAPVAVGPLLEDILSLHRRDHPGRPLTLDLTDRTLHLLADEGALFQVLMNFLTNAEKYSPPYESIGVTALTEGAEIRIVVADRGIGIEADVTALFEPFSRGKRAAERASGLGVGLAVSRKLTEAMNGRIGAAPRVEGGSEFWVTFPAAPPEV